jgi:hypothetical protein
MNPVSISIELARIHRQELVDDAARHRRIPRRTRSEQRARRSR